MFGKQMRLYRETQLACMVSIPDRPNNHPIYVVDTGIGASIFYNNLCFEEGDENEPKIPEKKGEQLQEELILDQTNDDDDGLCNMDFDGAVSKEGAGSCVWIIPLEGASKLCSFKLDFDCTNNVDEYEALIFGLNTLNDLKAKRIVVHGDSKLVIYKVKGIYQTKHPRMRAYRNAVLELLEGFIEYDVSLIPRG
jgi:hypothetical protein